MSGEIDKEDRIRQTFLEQGRICGSLGSSFMEHLLGGLGNQLDKTTITGKSVLEWQGNPEPKGDALALRLAGALHALVVRNDLPALAPFYHEPARAAEPEFLIAVLESIAKKDAEISQWLQFAPQTNEVGRSAIMYSGLLELARLHQLPIDLYELGSSAGLNLQLGKYGYRLGAKSFGAPDALVNLSPGWEGASPPVSQVEVVGRKGCDLNPLSVENELDCERLVAYLWPDQPKRIERVKAAITIARQDPPDISKSDAASWVENVMSEPSPDGRVRVLMHTIAWNYFPEDTKSRIHEAMNAAGEQATVNSPLAWLSFEFEGEGNPKLRLKVWPDKSDRVLASADPHVHNIKWH